MFTSCALVCFQMANAHPHIHIHCAQIKAPHLTPPLPNITLCCPAKPASQMLVKSQCCAASHNINCLWYGICCAHLTSPHLTSPILHAHQSNTYLCSLATMCANTSSWPQQTSLHTACTGISNHIIPLEALSPICCCYRNATLQPTSCWTDM